MIPCPVQEMDAPSSGGPAIPLTVSVWQSYANSIFSYSKFTGATMTMEGSGYGGPAQPHVPAAYADAVASAAVANGAGVGAESLALHDQVLYAAGSTCSNDWCNILNVYALEAPILGLQTIGKSDPTCTSDPGAANTCSLIYVLPFATQRHANVLEIANQDLLCAYAMLYSDPTTCPSSIAHPFAPYSTALANASAGQPAYTSATNGKASATGKTVLQ